MPGARVGPLCATERSERRRAIANPFLWSSAACVFGQMSGAELRISGRPRLFSRAAYLIHGASRLRGTAARQAMGAGRGVDSPFKSTLKEPGLWPRLRGRHPEAAPAWGVWGPSERRGPLDCLAPISRFLET